MILRSQRLDCYQVSSSACFHEHRQSRRLHGESSLQSRVVIIQISEEIREQRIAPVRPPQCKILKKIKSVYNQVSKKNKKKKTRAGGVVGGGEWGGAIGQFYGTIDTEKGLGGGAAVGARKNFNKTAIVA